MTRNHWNDFHRVWSHYTPPLRPHDQVVAAYRQHVAGPDGRVLVLGATPELADIAPDVVAVDKNPAMIANLWCAGGAGRRAVVGNWLCSAFAAGSVDVCLGDGSLNAVRFPDETALVCREIDRVLTPGGRLVVRIFARPEQAATAAEVEQAARRGRIGNFHAFKWRLAMAIAAATEQPNLEMGIVHDAITRMFPDRAELLAMTGWPREHIDTLDLLKDSVAISSFPTGRQIADLVSQTFGNVRLVPVGSYEVAECCPLLVAEKIATPCPGL